MRPQVADRGDSGPGELTGYNLEGLTVDHSGQRVGRVPRSLHVKEPFCRFQKEKSYASTEG